MRTASTIGLWLICVLAISGCASSGGAAQCPPPEKLPPVDAAMMQAPTFEKQVREILFESPPPVTPK